MTEGCTPARSRAGSLTRALHFQLKSHFGDAQWAKVFRIGGLGGALARHVPRRAPEPVLPGADGSEGAPGECGWTQGAGGSASGILALHVTFGNRVREAAETRLEPHGGRRARGQCPLPTHLGVQTLGFAVGTGDLIGALQRSPPFWKFPRIRVFSGPKTRKSHLLQKPKESEAQRPSLLTRP